MLIYIIAYLLKHRSLDGAIDMKVQDSSVCLPSLKILKLHHVLLDSIVALLSGCAMLETFDIDFIITSFTNGVPPPSPKSLKFTNDNFTWTYIEVDSCYPDILILILILILIIYKCETTNRKKNCINPMCQPLSTLMPHHH